MQAGVAKHKLSPKIGSELMGYGNRPSGSTGVHDDLYVRALVLDDGKKKLAFCSVEICYLRAPQIREIRDYVTRQTNFLAEHIFITTTHTHSAPAAHDVGAWDMPFEESVGSTILQADKAMQAAQIGVGAGLLMGHSINRRWLDRPADPAVGVIRVETMAGNPMAVIGNFACHAVVMGYDNFLISGDWPGYASRNLEETFGEDFVAIFMQGGAGDVNPLTETVQKRLTAGDPVMTIGELTTYYGDKDMAISDGWNIEDRAGGTFTECETLARAYVAEVQRIWQRVKTAADMQIWSEHVMIDAALSEDEPKPQTMPDFYRQLIPGITDEPLSLEITLIGIGDTVIIGQPGESFSETSVNFRKQCQQLGYTYAMFVTYANGSYGYLPPENAFYEGGYEVSWPLALGISRYTQARIQTAMMPILKKHIPK